MSAGVIAGVLGFGVLFGAAVGAGAAMVARRLRVARSLCPAVAARGFFLRLEPAALVSAAVPLAAWATAPSPATAVVMAVLGWLMLAVAICDERSFSIPHPLWLAGAAAGFWVVWRAGGWSDVVTRAYGIVVLDAALLGGTYLASFWRRRVPIGSADFGMVAFVGAVFGPVIAVEILLLAAVIALGCVAYDTAAITHRPRSSVLAAGAVAASLFGGLAGVVVGALALGWSIAREAGRGREPGPAPFGACLAAASICFVLVSAVIPQSAPPAVREDVVLTHLLGE